MHYLTKNFTLEELCKSDVALRRGIDNSPPPNILPNLSLVADNMEEVRLVLKNNPIIINSGYRSPALNKVIGGSSKHSKHMEGLAVDFVCPSFGAAYDVAWALANSTVEFDQLIYEGTWVHISFAWDNPRKEVMTARFDGGKVLYFPGINK